MKVRLRIRKPTITDRGLVISWLVLIGLLVFLLMPMPASASTLFYDDFSQEPVNQLDVGSLANWDIVTGSVDVVGNGNLCAGTCLDMDGTSYTKGSLWIQTGFLLLNSGHYEFFYSLGGSQRDFRFDTGNVNTVTGSVVLPGIGPLALDTTSLGSFDPFRQIVLGFQLAETTGVHLRFRSLEQPDYVGLLLDEVGLRSVPTPPPTPVPEPSTWLTFGAALAVMGYQGWRSRKGN